MRGKAQNVRTRGGQSGLTLIEVLVAVTLLGLLSAGLIAALRAASGSWADARERLTVDRRVANSNQLLHAQFAGMVPVRAQPPPNRRAPSAPFFHGEPLAMRFVSSYSMTEGVRGGLQIVELQVSEASQGLRLLLTQTPYRGPMSIGRFVMGFERGPQGSRLLFAPIEPRSDSLIVADQLAACSFAYLRRGQRRDLPDEWVPVWTDLQQIPEAVRVEMRSARQEPRLQPVTIVAEVRSRYGDPNPQPRAQISPNAEIIDTPQGPTLRLRRTP